MKKMRYLFSLLLFISFHTGFAQEISFVPGELLVQLRTGSDAMTFFKEFDAEQGISIHDVYCISPIVNIYQVKFSDEDMDLDQALRLFYQYPDILNVQKNHYVTQRETIPTDTLFNNQWHLKNTGQTGGTVDADIDAPEAWDVTTGGLTTHGDTIVVCIIEGSGVDINHIDIKDNHWKNYAEIPGDGIDNDNNGYVDDFNGWNVASDDDIINSGSHGTRVAGMAGAKGNNTTGVSGVNWDVKLMIVEGQQVSNEATVIEAYSYPLMMRKIYNESFGQSGAFVVVTNASWGINNGDPADSPLWCAMYDSLGTYGILNIGATTNSNINVDIQGDLPTTCPSEYLIGVTMTNSNDVRANSGYGTTHVDLGAPGNNVFLTNSGNVYSNTSGTSFASPCVAGAVALAYAAPCAEFINYVKYDPAGATLDMRNYILSSTDYKPALASEVATGGRLNVKNAIDSIIWNCDPSSCIPPYNLMATNLTDTSVTLSWSGFTTNYVVYLQENGGQAIEIPVNSAATLSIDTLLPCTYYTVTIKGDCSTDTSDFSFPMTFQSDGCCNNPDLMLDYKSEDSLIISWEAVLYASAYDVRYRPLGESVWSGVFTNASSPLVLEGLQPCVDYELQIKTTCTDSTQGYSESSIFRTLGCGACYEKEYCDVNGGKTSLEWIEHIALNGFSNNTGDNNGYYSSDQIIAALTPGQPYVIELTPGYSGSTFTERFTIWIDLDHNGVFDAAEILVNDQTASATVNFLLNIPVGATLGVTKMRIGMRALTGPDPCPFDPFWGEYEDYCVYIGPQVGIEENSSAISIYPNPSNGIVSISYSGKIEKVELFELNGKRVVSEANPIDNTIDINTLSHGVYIMKIHTDTGIFTEKLIKE